MNRYAALKIFLVLWAVLAGLFLWPDRKAEKEETGTIQKREACSEPLSFRIGTIDRKYRITQEELKQLLQDAAEAWSETAEKPLVVYSAEGEIEVNLVYGDIQELTGNEKHLRERINSEELRIKSLQKEYRESKHSYDLKLMEYNRKTDKNRERIEELNAWVNRKNEAGGFREDELEIFRKREKRIDEKTGVISRMEKSLTSRADRLNRMTDRINRLILEKNELIDQYNRSFSGEQQFTQGTYEWEGRYRAINVFKFEEKEELRLVLAHEMGHALGLDHVSNPVSVMYPKMEKQNRQTLRLTEEDRKAVQKLCGRNTSEAELHVLP